MEERQDSGEAAGSALHRARRPWLALAALAVVAWLSLEGFAATSWHFNRSYNPPLDDTYIYYQYAKQIARGQLYRYQDGEPPSTGSTSLIYPVLLAPFWLAGLHGKALFWGGYLVNLAGLLCAVLSVFLALRRLLPHDRMLPFLGGLLVIGNGWFLWGIASGMDTGVLAGALALTLHAAIRFCADARPRVWLLAGSVALLAVSRPEGLVLAWTIVLALWTWRWLEAMRAEPTTDTRALATLGRRIRAAFSRGARPPLALVAGLLAGTAPTFALALASGHLSTNGMALKSHFAFAIGIPRYLDVASRTLTAFPERLLWVPSAWLRSLLLLLVLAGVAGLWRGPSSRAADDEPARTPPRGPGLILGGSLLALFLFYGFLMAATEQHNRYYMAFTPLCVLLTVVGADTLASALRRPLQAALRRALVLSLALIGAASVPHWAKEYAHNAKDLADQHLKLAAWIDGNLPTDSRIAINDAGAIAYLGNRRVIDLLGLTTNAMRPLGHWREEGHMWEVMERMRPSHLAVYPSFFDDLHRLPVMRKVHSVNLGRDSLLGDREKVVYAIDWKRALPPERPHHLPREQAGWRLVDALDVADLESERAHAFRVRHLRVTGADRFRLRTFPAPGGKVVDGGRLHDGPASFVVRGLTPGRPLLLGVRSDFPLELKLEVRAGELRRSWPTGTAPQRQLREAYLVLPAEAVRAAELTLELTPQGEVRRGSGFAAFHYFVLQPR